MNKMINVILDPGHGGIDNNGNYTTNGKSFKFPDGTIAYEGVINRKITQALGDKLKRHGVNVIYTIAPQSPEDITLLQRVLKANQFDANTSLFISIHNNAAPTPGTARGFEIFTSNGKTKSDDLAESIFLSVKILYDALGLKMRSDTSDGDSDKEASFYVLDKTKMPAVLIEVLFFDNWDDYKLLSDSRFIDSVSGKIADGIIKYINKDD